MERSIFAGLTPGNLRIALEAAKQSPQALGAVVIVAVVAILLLAFAGAMAARHIGGFYARIQEEDERLRQEEEEQAARHGTENDSENDTGKEAQE